MLTAVTTTFAWVGFLDTSFFDIDTENKTLSKKTDESIEEAYITDDNGKVEFGNTANLSVETLVSLTTISAFQVTSPDFIRFIG